MACLYSCAISLLLIMSTSFSSDVTDKCLRQDSFNDWNSDEYRQHGCVLINWNLLPQTTCGSNDSCYGSVKNASFDDATLPQLIPIQIPPLTSICLQTVGVNVSRSHVAYHVTESEFVTCRHHNSTVTAFTAYNQLRSESNYFIASDARQCRDGLRINVTVTSFTCADAPQHVSLCSGRGRCVSDLDSGFKCICCQGFTGLTCSDEQSHTTVTEDSDCADGLQCPGATSRVLSDGGVEHLPCHSDGCADRCNTSTACLHGICVSGRCYCRPGYGGVRCELKYSSTVEAECQSSPCRNGGLCLPSITAASSSNVTCRCRAGYTGADCSVQASVCISNPCQHICIDHGQYYSCQCHSGYTGDRCQQKVDACHPSPCHHSALCQLSTNHLTGYVCLCTPGYHGNHCQYYSELELILAQVGGVGRPHLRSVRTAFCMLVISLVVVCAVVLSCYCHVQPGCSRLRLLSRRRRHLSYRYSAQQLGASHDMTSLLTSSSPTVSSPVGP